MVVVADVVGVVVAVVLAVPGAVEVDHMSVGVELSRSGSLGDFLNGLLYLSVSAVFRIG